MFSKTKYAKFKLLKCFLQMVNHVAPWEDEEGWTHMMIFPQDMMIFPQEMYAQVTEAARCYGVEIDRMFAIYPPPRQ